jgi:lambda family phage portal protein
MSDMYAWLGAGNRTARRGFDAAKVDRLTGRWATTGTAIDEELRGQLDPLRARSRDLFKNNEYAAKFGRSVRNNVVGTEGFTLQARVMDQPKKPDALANAAIESAWWRWMRPGNCDITGKYSFNDLMRVLAISLARDGEILLRRFRGNGFGEFGYQLQILDMQRLDTTANRARTANANAIVMGVEIDAYQRPVAYHFRNRIAGMNEIERIPAAEIIHRFIAQEPEQTRGIPWMHAAMLRLNDLNGYREAAVIAARIGASQMGMYVSPNGEPPNSDDTDADGNFITEVAPGEFSVAPPGYDFKTFDPKYPHEQFDAFNKATLRGIASAIGVSYNDLASDLEGVSFSSIRTGTLAEREEWMVIQNWLIGVLLTPLFEEWLEIALMGGKITLPNGTPLPAAKLAMLREHVWQPRRWSWVDPKKDMETAVLGMQNLLTSPQKIAASQGVDIEDILDDISAFEQMVAAKGLTLPAPPNAPAAPAPEPSEEDKALRLQTAAALSRSLDVINAQREQGVHVHLNQEPAQISIPAPVVNITNQRESNPAPVVNVTVEPTPVTVHVEPTPVNVNVEPAQVTVELEANLPEQNITLEMPARRTETVIERDGLGRIKSTTQLESDI